MNTNIESVHNTSYDMLQEISQETSQNNDQYNTSYETLQEGFQEELQEGFQEELQETLQGSYDAIKLKLHMRKLWTDHAIFIRQFIVDLLGNLPDIDYTTERLFKNQEQTGNCFECFFGDVAASNMISLLKEHVTITIDLLKSIKNGNMIDATSLEDIQITNIENICTLLCTINQCYSIGELSDILKTYLILTKYQFIARMNGDYNGDIIYLDMGLNHILRISDYLSNGITEAFFED